MTRNSDEASLASAISATVAIRLELVCSMRSSGSRNIGPSYCHDPEHFAGTHTNRSGHRGHAGREHFDDQTEAARPGLLKIGKQGRDTRRRAGPVGRRPAEPLPGNSFEGIVTPGK